MSDNRTERFRRNESLELMLSELSEDLRPAEEQLLSAYRHQPMQYPLVLVMGPLRSGTTLFMQWLANTGVFAYPSNLLSRFYQAPIIGAKIQLLLTDPQFNFRDELSEFLQKTEFKSENGKTKGVLAPNEFWYFWRRFLAEPMRDVWTDEELRLSMDTQIMLAELAGVMDVFQKPFIAKGMLFNYNIPFINSVIEKILFIQIKRDLVANVASVLDARKCQFGREDTWYSFKIPEYPSLVHLDPVDQAAGQVYFINNAVERGLLQVDESRKIKIQYEEFCENPEGVFEQIMAKLCIKSTYYQGPASFDIPRQVVNNKEMILEALLKFRNSTTTS